MPSSSQVARRVFSGGDGGDLGVKLMWVTVFRTVATTVLLGATAVRLLSGPGTPVLEREDTFAFVFIGGLYLLTVFYGFWLRRGQVGPAAAWVQIGGDVLFATCLVYVTGGAESPFTFTYLVAILAAAILVLQRGAQVAAAASGVTFLLVSLSIQLGFPRAPLGIEALPTVRFFQAVSFNLLAQFGIAVLSVYLGRELSAAGGKLSETTKDLESLARLQTQILACMQSGLMTCDAEGTITYINRAASAILGIVGLGDAPTKVEELLPGVLKVNRLGRRAEMTVSTRAGNKVLGITVTPLEGKAGELLLVFQDLTELRRMEETLRRVDQLAALGKLSAQLAHEIRNPLASMRGVAQLLSSNQSVDAAAGRLSGVLIRESDRLSDLVEGFLRFAKPPEPSLKECALHELISETVEMLAVDPLASGIPIDLELEEIVASVDSDQIRQALINLLRNAFSAAAPGGKVKVTLDSAQGYPRIHVWDSGGKIPAVHMPRIFEPFFTTREGGTGLGLSTAHSIVRAHGGMIQVTSSPDEGTEFVIGLPESKESARADSGR